MMEAEQVPDLMRQRRLEIIGPESTVGRELLEWIQDNIGFRNKALRIIKAAGLGRGSLGILSEKQNVFRRGRDSDQANAVACGSGRADTLPIGTPADIKL